MLRIVATTDQNTADMLRVEREAFGEDDDAELTRQLMTDSTALPMISLLAYDQEAAVGHILLTNATLTGHEDIKTMILAPLAVVPGNQRIGVGTALTLEALKQAGELGVQLVFVLGSPEYYPRHGFLAPAEPLGFEPPYPIPKDAQPAWMVQELSPGLIGQVQGRVVPADSLMRPEYWRE